MSQARLSACMLIPHKSHTDTIQVYSVTVMTHVKTLWAGHSSQGTSEPITPAHEQLFLSYHASLFGGHSGRNRTLPYIWFKAPQTF